ncbi:MAG: hypothetical protein HY363_01510 [Candidatus Aenigmarchaeota archaeon]|nr:hypothetical protein [Candidatus Aenigmarchaeota archaeon]
MRRLLLLLFLLSLPVVYSVGIRGNNLRVMIDFEPNKQLEFDYAVIANAGFTQDYELRAVGDLAEYVTFEPAKIEALPDGGRGPFKAIIRFPSEITAPGIHPLELFVDETMVRGSNDWNAGASVGAKVSAVAQIMVRVRYPEKKLAASLSLSDVDEHQPLAITANVENWGKTDFSSVWADFAIYNLNNTKLETLVSNKVNLATLEQKKVSALLDTAKYEPGEYRIKATVHGDEITEELNGTFRIGALAVEIIEATATFKNSSINQFNVKVRNRWNNAVSDVYAIIRIGPSEVQTPTVVLKAWEERILTGYWDTTGFEIGEHDAYITLHYNGKTASAKVKVEIIPDLEAQTEKPISTTATFAIGLLTLLMLLIIINAVLLFRLKKQ